MTTFLELWRSLSPEEKRALARQAGTSTTYLSHLANGQRKAGARMMACLPKLHPEITPALLRPDLFGVVHD